MPMAKPNRFHSVKARSQSPPFNTRHQLDILRPSANDTEHREFLVRLLGFVLQPALELPGNVILPQLQAGIPQGRTRKLM